VTKTDIKLQTKFDFPEVLNFSNCNLFPKNFYSAEKRAFCTSDVNEVEVYPDIPLDNEPTENFHEVCTDVILKSAAKMSYRLSAVIRHNGDRVGSGHYIVDVRPNNMPYSRSGLEMWNRCNDNKVEPTPKVNKLTNFNNFLLNIIELFLLFCLGSCFGAK
jgi:uncharacterized UBP type Zn finger protein